MNYKYTINIIPAPLNLQVVQKGRASVMDTINRKKKFTFAEHQSLGEELCLMRERLIRLNCELDRIYGRKRKLGCLASKAYICIDELRNKLDSLVFEENPDLETNELAGAYYCANRLREPNSHV